MGERDVDPIDMTEDSDSVSPPVDALDALDALVQNLPGALFCALGDDGFRIPTPASLELSEQQIIPVPADRATMVDLVVPADRMVVITTWERARATGIAMGQVRTVHQPDEYVTVTILDARSRHGVFVGVDRSRRRRGHAERRRQWRRRRCSFRCDRAPQPS